MVEKSRPYRKETLIISVKLQPIVIHSKVGGCDQCKKQDFQAQEALHHQTYMKDKPFCRSDKPRMPLKLYIVKKVLRIIKLAKLAQ